MNLRLRPCEGDAGERKVNACASLQGRESVGGESRTPLFSSAQDDSSRNVTANGAERTESRELAPETSDDALKLAIKLAVDAGEYERAAALLDVAKRTTKPASVTPIDSARGRDRER